MEFIHKLREGEGAEAGAVDRDPVVHQTIFKATDNFCNLFVFGYGALYIQEKVFCVVFEVPDCVGCDLSVREVRGA